MKRDTNNNFNEHVSASGVSRWCQVLVDDRKALFTHELAPLLRVSDIVHDCAAWPHAIDDAAQRRLREVVNDVCERRRTCIGHLIRESDTYLDDRRLVYLPNFTDFSGLGTETGVVDNADTPAWDLWTATATYKNQFCIVSYVPQRLVSAADRAILLSPSVALAWCTSDELQYDNS